MRIHVCVCVSVCMCVRAYSNAGCRRLHFISLKLKRAAVAAVNMIMKNDFLRLRLLSSSLPRRVYTYIYVWEWTEYNFSLPTHTSVVTLTNTFIYRHIFIFIYILTFECICVILYTMAVWTTTIPQGARGRLRRPRCWLVVNRPAGESTWPVTRTDRRIHPHVSACMLYNKYKKKYIYIYILIIIKRNSRIFRKILVPGRMYTYALLTNLKVVIRFYNRSVWVHYAFVVLIRDIVLLFVFRGRETEYF